MASLATAVLVDTLQQCQDAVAQLFQEAEVAIDIEGVDLSRAGEVCLIQACGRSGTVFLFDIHTLKDEAFELGGLKAFLESDVIKVFYDVRADCDALHHLHRADVRASFDLQVLRALKFQDATDLYLHGLKRVLAEFLQESGRLTEDQVQGVEALKEQVHELFETGTEIWRERPLSPLLIQYAAVDVQFLLGMKRFWLPEDPMAARQLQDDVMRASDRRWRRFVALPPEYALHQSSKRIRDVYEADDTSHVLHVPTTRAGALIGKKGANIQAIRATSGAQVCVRDDVAMVVGRPENVEAAVQLILAKIAERPERHMAR
ncbi:Exd1 [Symbiodinium natans]|uniref:Exd1 protein n=1 Tax=Symbiodinium natans TaxID=878477 RepID=A0A812R8V6_9DINO|nr:Exd1 [Symbiodinium natans]